MITLDKTNYPLVVGSKNKLTFEDWENSGSSVKLTACIHTEKYKESDIQWIIEDPQIVSFVCRTEDETGGLNCKANAVCEVRGRTTGYTHVWAQLPDGSRAGCFLTVKYDPNHSTESSF